MSSILLRRTRTKELGVPEQLKAMEIFVRSVITAAVGKRTSRRVVLRRRILQILLRGILRCRKCALFPISAICGDLHHTKINKGDASSLPQPQPPIKLTTADHRFHHVICKFDLNRIYD
jgi:hypothetical protein